MVGCQDCTSSCDEHQQLTKLVPSPQGLGKVIITPRKRWVRIENQNEEPAVAGATPHLFHSGLRVTSSRRSVTACSTIGNSKLPLIANNKANNAPNTAVPTTPFVP